MTIRRREFLQGTAGLALGALVGGGCGVGQETASKEAVTKTVPAKVDGDLLIFNWTEYMDPELIKAFEQRYSVKVRQANFDSMPAMMAKLRAGNEYDLIFPTADYVNRLVRANMLLQLEREKLKNSDNIFPFFDDPWYDKDSAHTVPYAMYTTGIAWREDKVDGHERLLERPREREREGQDVHARRLPGGDRPGQPAQRLRPEHDRPGRARADARRRSSTRRSSCAATRRTPRRSC